MSISHSALESVAVLEAIDEAAWFGTNYFLAYRFGWHFLSFKERAT
jgi:hypothetical protein